MKKQESFGDQFDSYFMNGGDGPFSYSNNSSHQRQLLETTREIIKKDLRTIIDINLFTSSSTMTFRIADLGCSTGPNTFIAMQNIVEALELLDIIDQPPEVSFVDHGTNDFNTLFKMLPNERKYFAAGVPGSYHSRLFPKASVHIFHSSYALHWLSNVPKEVMDKNSLAWNKEKIHYKGARKEVFEAYYAQFGEDMTKFLHARAEELVAGGLMVLLIPATIDHANQEVEHSLWDFDILGSSLMDMVKMGIIEEEKVATFNMPKYYPSRPQMKKLIRRTNCFKIEKMKMLSMPSKNLTMPDINERASHIRAAYEGVIAKHFGEQIVDKLFDLYSQKAANSLSYHGVNQNSYVLYALLKLIVKT